MPKVTMAGDRTRVSVMNTQPLPPPSVVERAQEAPGGEKYVTSEWILQDFAWDMLPTMDKVNKDFIRIPWEVKLKYLIRQAVGNYQICMGAYIGL